MHFPPQPRGTWKSWQIFSNYLQFKHKSACSPHTHGMQKVLPPTLATNLAMNIFAQNGSRQAGRQHGAAFPDCLPCALHTSRRGRETFYLAPSQLDKRVSPRLPAARQVSVSPDRFPNNFDNFFSLLLVAKKFRGTLTEMIDDSR